MRRALTFLPPLVLVLSAGYLGLMWDRLPASWPVHWGLDGRPDGFAIKSPLSAFAPMLIGLVLWLGLERLAWWMEARPKHQLDKETGASLLAASSDLFRWAALAMALVLALVGAILPLHPEVAGQRWLPLVIVALMGGILAAGVLSFRARTRHLELPEGYGLMGYSKAGDKRLWVPKVTGHGWTLNMAHPLAWPVLGLLIGVPILLIWLSRR